MTLQEIIKVKDLFCPSSVIEVIEILVLPGKCWNLLSPYTESGFELSGRKFFSINLGHVGRKWFFTLGLEV